MDPHMGIRFFTDHLGAHGAYKDEADPNKGALLLALKNYIDEWAWSRYGFRT
jgi:hypothetical protein